MMVIEQWTGRHVEALRLALRMTRESLAERLGVAPRTVTKWKDRPEKVPTQHLQGILDDMLAEASPDALTRFAANLGVQEPRITLDQTSIGELNAAVNDLARLLTRIELGALGQQPSAP
ncbi:helix-turn-helix transcriptional regulator [Kribbella sp. NPDC051770]|uniref:helix-turn-helix transcriptional regulator n=1 Tax=Kribbella sp. NPDC051770 TaxID=3155413 RepID=UPI00341B9719